MCVCVYHRAQAKSLWGRTVADNTLLEAVSVVVNGLLAAITLGGVYITLHQLRVMRSESKAEQIAREKTAQDHEIDRQLLLKHREEDRDAILGKEIEGYLQRYDLINGYAIYALRLITQLEVWCKYAAEALGDAGPPSGRYQLTELRQLISFHLEALKSRQATFLVLLKQFVASADVASVVMTAHRSYCALIADVEAILIREDVPTMHQEVVERLWHMSFQFELVARRLTGPVEEKAWHEIVAEENGYMGYTKAREAEIEASLAQFSGDEVTLKAGSMMAPHPPI